MPPAGYYRDPTIHENRVVFVCEDDLWEVSARGGGTARRLTANRGMVSKPAFSPDGQWLAFTGREEGETEVYVMPAAGGPATRLTYLGHSSIVVGWTAAGEIIFSSNAGQPFFQLTPLYAISPTEPEAQPRPLNVGPARSIAFGPQGQVVIGRRADDLANWKRYRGGTAGDIWIDREGEGRFEPLLQLDSNLANPLWLGERIYFLSDHEGIGNIYSCLPSGEDLQRHTHHEDFYVRNPATDGRRIIYRAGADLYLFDPGRKAKRKYRKLKIEFHSPRVERNRKFVRGATYMDHYTIHPRGHSVALTTRGKAFAMSNWEGAALQYGESQGVRYRLIEWLNDLQRLVMISDATGEEAIEIHADDPENPGQRTVKRLAELDIGRAIFLKVLPRGDTLLIANHRYELLHVDLQTETLRLLDKSDYGRIAGADWSMDGQWVAYGFRSSLYSCAIKLCHLESDETYFVTPPNTMWDYGPSFDPGGKYLYFISYRDFDPVPDSHYFDLNFPRGGRPYLVTLQKEQPNPFIPMPETIDQKKAEPDQKKEKDEEKADTTSETNKTMQIDLEGIEHRIVPLPVSESRYHQVRGIKDKVLFTSFPIEGTLDRHWLQSNEPGKGALEMYDLTEQKKDFVVSGLNGFDLCRDKKFLIYRSGKNLRILKAGEKPESNASGYNKKSGWIKLNRAKVAVNPPDEWRQMFREAWRLQRDHFWTEDMSKVDWQRVYERYYPLIERITTRSEFSDLMRDMQGELGTSHTYELGGDYNAPPHYYQGLLGADLAYDPKSDGYRITHIVRGDSWLEEFDSPLNRVGANIEVGDILLAINGQRLSRELSPHHLLVNQAKTELQLTVLTPTPDEGEPKSRTVLVKTLLTERKARYREWVETNRRRVHEETDLRVGYVHIPDMGPFGYAEFHRYYLAESEYMGLIVDVRFNGGGNVSQLLLEKLTRRRIGYKRPRYGEAYAYPHHSVLGPMVALTNEFSGSDGDIFSHAFKLLELGPLIGKRTWGGVIGVWPRHTLVDGTYTTQPEFSNWFEDVGWAIENYGTDPDIEVEITPQDYAGGRDPQLEQAIAEISRLLAEEPPQLPQFEPPPSRALPRLPKMK